jgi:8-oxo-dGTP pyrophosphatase MutT (NUDIX family)
MKNFPIEHEGKTYWISRAVAVAGYVFDYCDGKLFVLAAKRGKGSSDFQGYWNIPCGYLDFDETTAEACCRELDEETNLKIYPNNLHLFDVEDSPTANKQNVTFRYWTYSTFYYKNQNVYAKGEEEDEVEEVKWIPIEELDQYEFAFNQKKTIGKIVSTYLYTLVPKQVLLNLTTNV